MAEPVSMTTAVTNRNKQLPMELPCTRLPRVAEQPSKKNVLDFPLSIRLAIKLSSA